MRRPPLAFGAALVATILVRPAHASASASALDTAISQAYQAAYSLDQDASLTAARSAIRLAPDDPRAHRTLAAVLWLDILYKRGAVTIDAYLGGLTRSLLSLPRAPADLDAEFKREAAKAVELADRRLDVNGADLSARFELGTAYGLQASYAASVDGSLTSALLAGRHAYDAEETVLERDPSRIGAGVIVGTYRYVVATLGLPSRMFAYMIGFGGGKEKGIGLVEAAQKDADAHVEARTSLVLIYSREGRHADAEHELDQLATEFPKNRLFRLEEGGAAVRAGHSAAADAILTQGLAQFDGDNRVKSPGERALWLFTRGRARFGLRHYTDAETDLNAALGNDPMPWVRGRIELELGRVADAAGRRDVATTRYKLAKQLSDAANDPLASDEAARLLRGRS